MNTPTTKYKNREATVAPQRLTISSVSKPKPSTFAPGKFNYFIEFTTGEKGWLNNYPSDVLPFGIGDTREFQVIFNAERNTTFINIPPAKTPYSSNGYESKPAYKTTWNNSKTQQANTIPAQLKMCALEQSVHLAISGTITYKQIQETAEMLHSWLQG